MNCPKCDEISESRGQRDFKQRYQCKNNKCHVDHNWKGWFSVDMRYATEYDVEDISFLTIDIETAPMLVWNWGLSTPSRRLSINNIYQEWFVISWAAKWLDKDEILSGVVTPEEAKNQDDKRIIEEIWNLLEKPSAVISHNGGRFDLPKLRDRYLLHGLGPNLPFKLIDTYKIARRLGSTSHKLDYIAQRHLRNAKIETDFQLWKDCVMGDPKALQDMLKYKKHDVVVGEDVYKLLRSWEYGPLNHGLFNRASVPVCRACGGTIEAKNKSKATPMNLYSVYRCIDCGYCGTMKNTKLTVNERRNLTK